MSDTQEQLAEEFASIRIDGSDIRRVVKEGKMDIFTAMILLSIFGYNPESVFPSDPQNAGPAMPTAPLDPRD